MWTINNQKGARPKIYEWEIHGNIVDPNIHWNIYMAQTTILGANKTVTVTVTGTLTDCGRN